MRKFFTFSFLAIFVSLTNTSFLHASAFKTATVTEVINDVKVVKGAGKPAPAKVKETITSQDIIRTGRDSRAELRFQDNTLARVGSSSVFSFSPDKREINLQQGSVLFNSDKGKGGGQIKTAAATAAVTGTTIIVAATANGGFKLLILEGKSRVQLPGGAFVDMQAGQMTFINPGQNTRPEVLTFDLEALIKGSKLVEGFSDPLDSMEKVQSAIDKQNKLIADGKLNETGHLIAFINEQGDVQIIDMNSLTQILDIDLVLELAQEGVNQASAIQAALDAAFTQDHYVNTSTVNPARIFTDVAGLKSSTYNSDGFYNSLPNATRYAPARDTYIQTQYLDLGAFNDLPYFAFLSEGNLYMNGGLFDYGEGFDYATYTYGPLNHLIFQARGDIIFNQASFYFNDYDNMLDEVFNVVDNVTFKAQGSFYAPDGTYIYANYSNLSFDILGNFFLGNPNSWFTIDGVNLSINVGGDIFVQGGGYLYGYDGISISSQGSLTIDRLGSEGYPYLNSYAGNISIQSGGDASIKGAKINSPNGSFSLTSGGNLYLNSYTEIDAGGIMIQSSGPITSILNSELTAGSGDIAIYNMNANGQILVNDSYFNASGALILSSQSLIDLNNVSLASGTGNIIMQAYTINLANIDFPGGSTVHLTSGLDNSDGYPHFNYSSPGRVNFIENVSKGGTGNIMNDEYTFDLYRYEGTGDIILNDSPGI